jgi:hypothetical protein
LIRGVTFDNGWYSLREVSRGAFLLVRRAFPFVRGEDIEIAHEALLAALERVRPRALLIDAREAPARNDPEFERRFAVHRVRMLRTASHVALLIRSEAGRLQVKRLSRQDGVPFEIFHDEERANDWLAKR